MTKVGPVSFAAGGYRKWAGLCSTYAIMQVWIDRSLSFRRGSVIIWRRYCKSAICLTRISARDLSFLRFLLDSEHSLPVTKLACFDLIMTTAVNCCGNIHFWQSADQEKVAADVERGLLLFSCSNHIWWPMLLLCHVVVQGSITSSKTNLKIPRRRIELAMVTLKAMKECPVLWGLQPRCELRVPEEISSGVGTKVVMTFIIQSR